MKCTLPYIHKAHAIVRFSASARTDVPTGEHCEGVTSWDIAQQGRRKQEALKNDAQSFATRYSIHVSAQSLRSNGKVWREVERALERQYRLGLEHGREGGCIHENDNGE